MVKINVLKTRPDQPIRLVESVIGQVIGPFEGKNSRPQNQSNRGSKPVLLNRSEADETQSNPGARGKEILSIVKKLDHVKFHHLTTDIDVFNN